MDVTPAPREADDPLAQLTRSRLFGLLAELRRPADIDELSEAMGLHPNGVRLHLDRLVKAGLLERETVGGRRGRPRHRWSIAPGAMPGGEAPSAYESLAAWLARSIAARPGRLREVERTGRDIGRELAPRAVEAPREALDTVLAALGFAPAPPETDGSTTTWCLGNCPYRGAVKVNQEVVCGLHRGITRGLLDRLAPGARLVAFVPRDPEAAGCRIEVSGLAPDEA